MGFGDRGYQRTPVRTVNGVEPDGNGDVPVSTTALPQGVLGYAQTTTPQSGVTARADATGLSVAVTVGASRRIRVKAYVESIMGSANGRNAVYLNEGATQLTRWIEDQGVGGFEVLAPEIVLTPSAGAHTYKVQLESTAGSTLNTQATATTPCWLLVEDIGPA